MTEADDQLAEFIRTSLRTQADRIHAADDVFDPSRVSAQQLPEGAHLDATSNHGRGRVLIAVAASVALVVIAAGILLAQGGSGQSDIATVPAPKEELHHVLPPLAPTGIDWWIETYRPNADHDLPPEYAVDFHDLGYIWRLDVGGNGPEPQGDSTAIGDRSVWMSPSDAEPGHFSVASWKAESGVLVQLQIGGIEVDPAVGPSAGSLPAPTAAEWKQVVARIQPVDDEAWLAALNPSPGRQYPPFIDSAPPVDMTIRPLHLGLDAAPERTRLSVQPWTITQSELDIAGFERAAFRLVTDTTPMAAASDRATLASDAVDIRGREGRLDTLEPSTTPIDGDGAYGASWSGGTWVPGYNRTITWSEGGSTVTLQFVDGPTVDDAVAVANSLVILDDSQWTALLFPMGDAVIDQDDEQAEMAMPETTTSTTPPTTVPEEVAPLPEEPVGRPGPSNLYASLELDGYTAIPAGETIEGRVVVTNYTDAAIEVEGCPPPFDIGLSSLDGTIENWPIRTAIGCVDPLVFPPGESTWPVTISTTFSSCVNSESTDPSTPSCLPGGGMPTLPPGTYSAHIFGPAEIGISDALWSVNVT